MDDDKKDIIKAEEQKIFTAAEKELTDKFAAESDKYHSRVSYTQTTKEDGKTEIESVYANKQLSEQQQKLLTYAVVSAMSGMHNYEYNTWFANQTANALAPMTTTAETYSAAVAFLSSMSPADPIEGMLRARLFVLHNHSLTYIGRAANPQQTMKGADMNVNRSTKIMRLYNETLDALNKHKRKGEQKVVVQHQHVNVSEGGQAIVGSNITREGEGNMKNFKGEDHVS